MVLVPARRAAHEVTSALTSPIYGRRTVMRWDDRAKTWVPAHQERAANVTPAGVIGVGALAAAVAAAAWLMGVRADIRGPDEYHAALRKVAAIDRAIGLKSQPLGIPPPPPVPPRGIAGILDRQRYQERLARYRADVARLSEFERVRLADLKRLKEERRGAQIDAARLRVWPFRMAPRDQFKPQFPLFR
jgi:hypothetical protein